MTHVVLAVTTGFFEVKDLIDNMKDPPLPHPHSGYKQRETNIQAHNWYQKTYMFGGEY